MLLKVVFKAYFELELVAGTYNLSCGPMNVVSEKEFFIASGICFSISQIILKRGKNL